MNRYVSWYYAVTFLIPVGVGLSLNRNVPVAKAG